MYLADMWGKDGEIMSAVCTKCYSNAVYCCGNCGRCEDEGCCELCGDCGRCTDCCECEAE